MASHFAQGEIVQLWGTDHNTDRTDYMAPARVVEDSPGRTVLYTAVETPIMSNGPLIDRILDPTTPDLLRSRRWRDTDMLSIVYPGDMFSTWAMWDMPAREFRGWYVNIEKPMTRTEIGFKTTDLTLDVVVRPDLSWFWKDEDEFSRLIELGYYSSEFAAEVCQAGLEAVSRLESSSPPFSEPWSEWKPDASWIVPEFPSTWEVDTN